MRANQSQFEIMIEFMEKHGDLCKMPAGSLGRLENLKKWHDLIGILNSKGETKSLEKWRKAWSDFKNNTKRKYERIQKKGGIGPEMTDNEKRLLQLIGLKRERRRETHSDDENGVVFKVEDDTDSCKASLLQPQYFCAAEAETSHSQNSSSSSYAASSCSSPERKKRKIAESEGNMKELTDRFLAFEKERERMSHERELARIQQNDKIITVLDRFVNVFESLTPSIQRCLERYLNEGG